VIATTTASDRVLLCQAQTGNRLARIDHLRPRTGNQIGVLPGFAGNPGKQLQEVERTALAGEQGARRSLDFAKQLIRVDALAILRLPDDGDRRIEPGEAALEPGGPTKNGVFTSNHRGAPDFAGGNQLCGQVAAPDILAERGRDVALDFRIQHGCKGHDNSRTLRADLPILPPKGAAHMLDLLLVGLGVMLALAFAGGLVYLYVQDVTQEKHAVLRNFPLVGHLRYFFETLGEYFRQYFFLGDRDEMPFDRATRSWVYRMAKNEGRHYRLRLDLPDPYARCSGFRQCSVPRAR
jgi:hypothetical protein